MNVLFIITVFLFNILELFQGHLFIGEADVDEVLHNFGCILLIKHLISRHVHSQTLEMALKQLFHIKQHTHSTCECSLLKSLKISTNCGTLEKEVLIFFQGF